MADQSKDISARAGEALKDFEITAREIEGLVSAGERWSEKKWLTRLGELARRSDLSKTFVHSILGAVNFGPFGSVIALSSATEMVRLALLKLTAGAETEALAEQLGEGVVKIETALLDASHAIGSFEYFRLENVADEDLGLTGQSQQNIGFHLRSRLSQDPDDAFWTGLIQEQIVRDPTQELTIARLSSSDAGSTSHVNRSVGRALLAARYGVVFLNQRDETISSPKIINAIRTSVAAPAAWEVLEAGVFAPATVFSRYRRQPALAPTPIMIASLDLAASATQQVIRSVGGSATGPRWEEGMRRPGTPVRRGGGIILSGDAGSGDNAGLLRRATPEFFRHAEAGPIAAETVESLSFSDVEEIDSGGSAPEAGSEAKGTDGPDTIPPNASWRMRARAPESIVKDQVFELNISFIRSELAKAGEVLSEAFKAKTGEEVLVHIAADAPLFIVKGADLEFTLGDADSETGKTAKLVALESGPAAVRLHALIKGEPVAVIDLDLAVTDAAGTGGDTGPQAEKIADVEPAPAQASDWSINISFEGDGGTIKVKKDDHPVRSGALRLTREQLGAHIGTIAAVMEDQVSGRRGGDSTQLQTRLRTISQRLGELLPQDILDLLPEMKGQIVSVYEDRHSFPVELLPVGRELFGDVAHVCRRVYPKRSAAPNRDRPVDAQGVWVALDDMDPQFDVDWSAIEAVAAAQRSNALSLSRFTNPAALSAKAEALDNRICVHFACHGDFADAGPELLFGADTKLTVYDFTAEACSNFAVALLNACNSNAQELRPSNFLVNGLADEIAAQGAAIVIGTLWPIATPSASAFSKAFYKAAFDGETAANAFKAGREAAQAFAAKGDPSFTAYCFYGDPFLTVNWLAPAPSPEKPHETADTP